MPLQNMYVVMVGLLVYQTCSYLSLLKELCSNGRVEDDYYIYADQRKKLWITCILPPSLLSSLTIKVKMYEKL